MASSHERVPPIRVRMDSVVRRVGRLPRRRSKSCPKSTSSAATAAGEDAAKRRRSRLSRIDPAEIKTKKMARQAMLEWMEMLEFSVSQSDYDSANRIMFKLRRLEVSEKLLRKTNGGIRLSALIKRVRARLREAKEQNHRETRAFKEDAGLYEKMKLIKRTWMSEIQSKNGKLFARNQAKVDEESRKERERIERMKRQRKVVMLDDVKVSRTTVCSSIPSSKTTRRSRSETATKRTKRKRFRVSDMRPSERQEMAFRLAQGVASTSVVRMIQPHSYEEEEKRKRRREKRLQKRRHASVPAPRPGDESSDMEATFHEIEEEEERSRLIGEEEDRNAVL